MKVMSQQSMKVACSQALTCGFAACKGWQSHQGMHSQAEPGNEPAIELLGFTRSLALPGNECQVALPPVTMHRLLS